MKYTVLQECAKTKMRKLWLGDGNKFKLPHPHSYFNTQTININKRVRDIYVQGNYRRTS